MSDVIIPHFGESINSANISTWHVPNGTHVSQGDVIVTLETDKVATELEAPDSGILTIISQEGEEVSIGTVIATITAEDATETVPTPSPSPQTTPPPAQQPPKTPTQKTPTPPANTPSSSDRYTRTSMSRIRRTIAAKLVEVQHQAAILTTFNECDMTAIMQLRKQFKETEAAKQGAKLGIMSFFIKAVVHALQAVPEVNARIDGVDLIQNHYYDISVAIGSDKGLVVPVIRDCDKKSDLEIERDLSALVEKVKAGTLTLSDLEGGVFTVSNGGTYGSMLSTPILNPPQSGVLGMHAIMERPMAKDGQVVILPMMYLALSYDHRLIDGKQAVTFLVKVKESLENPILDV